MNGAQARKKGKKRKAESGEHPADAEDAPKQSAGITNILKRFRSTHKEPSEGHIQQGDLVKDAAAAPSGLELADADFQELDYAAGGADDAAAARDISEDAHETAEHAQGNSNQLPASQSRPGNLKANDAEEEDDERGKHKSKQKQPKRASDAVLPWMRLPVSIAAGQGVQLGNVGGLDPRLRDKMLAGQLTVITPSHLLLFCACRLSVLAEDMCQPKIPLPSLSSVLHITIHRGKQLSGCLSA